MKPLKDQLIKEELLSEIEEALDITLCGWQRDYLLRKPIYDFNLRITGKGTGKTLAWILRQLCENVEEPLYLRTHQEVLDQCDWWSVSPSPSSVQGYGYINYYRNFILETRDKLVKSKIPVRDIIL